MPDYPIPNCSPFDGLYQEIQVSPFGWSWCVDRYTGEEINGTMTEAGRGKPLCPGMIKIHLAFTQWAKSPKKQSENSALKI